MTALTLTETLSRVITSWGGTSMATVRRLTLTILSMNGISRTRPGPGAVAAGIEDGLGPAAEAEDDAPLVLAQDAHRGDEDEEQR